MAPARRLSYIPSLHRPLMRLSIGSLGSNLLCEFSNTLPSQLSATVCPRALVLEDTTLLGQIYGFLPADPRSQVMYVSVVGDSMLS